MLLVFSPFSAGTFYGLKYTCTAWTTCTTNIGLTLFPLLEPLSRHHHKVFFFVAKPLLTSLLFSCSMLLFIIFYLFIYLLCMSWESHFFLFCCFQQSVNVAYSCTTCVSFRGKYIKFILYFTCSKSCFSVSWYTNTCINFICILTLLCMHFCFVLYVILYILLCNNHKYQFGGLRTGVKQTISWISDNK